MLCNILVHILLPFTLNVSYFIAADLLRNIVQCLYYPQPELLSLLILGHCDILNVSHQPELVNAVKWSAYDFTPSTCLSHPARLVLEWKQSVTPPLSQPSPQTTASLSILNPSKKAKKKTYNFLSTTSAPVPTTFLSPFKITST